MSLKPRIFIVSLLAAISGALVSEAASKSSQFPQLAKVRQAMLNGAQVKVAYLGGSITWGATATDPLKTSWRALVTSELEARYPKAHIQAIDASIGGQPSRLGVFRMDRDVLPYKPDLCFIEFAVNDWGNPDSGETMEGIIRKLRACREDMAIVIVIIGSNWNYDESPARAKHLELAAHYGLPAVDIYTAVRAKMEQGLKTKDILTDGCHPNDAGYRLYADVVLADVERLAEAKGPAVPVSVASLTTNRFEKAAMIELARLPDLGGWKVAIPSVTGTWFDQQPSRWHSSSIEPAKDGAELSLETECSGLGLYFELTGNGGPITLSADGQPVQEIATAQALPFSRVNYTFKMLDGPTKKRKVMLAAAQAANTKAAYLLYTK